MNKEFENLKNAVIAHQTKTSQIEQDYQRKYNLERERQITLAQNRIFNNENLLKSIGIKSLFEKIKSENILRSETYISDNLEGLKRDINILFRTSIRNESFEDCTKRILSTVDSASSVSLNWDYKKISDPDRDLSEQKHINVFVENNNIYLNFSSKKKHEPKLVKNNLTELVTYAIINAEGV